MRRGGKETNQRDGAKKGGEQYLFVGPVVLPCGNKKESLLPECFVTGPKGGNSGKEKKKEGDLGADNVLRIGALLKEKGGSDRSRKGRERKSPFRRFRCCGSLREERKKGGGGGGGKEDGYPAMLLV